MAEYQLLILIRVAWFTLTDLEHFVEENNGLLESLFNDFRGLPSQWGFRGGVLDRVSNGGIITGEIVQGRARDGLLKIFSKLYRSRVKCIEKLISHLMVLNYKKLKILGLDHNKADGSHPWKMSFIGFLLGE
jgi:hypothetical protein